MTKSLFDASKSLYDELSKKKFPRNKLSAYLSCFVSIKAVVEFLTAYEKEEKRLQKEEKK